ncbi:MAG: GAF domain-containing protein [SAR202 cluster bacterium]|nr:GAF domain-containing protein [SAR202 cluster bacterium]
MENNVGKGENETLLDGQLQTFYQVNRFISSIRNIDELLGLIMQESESAVSAEASCIALYHPEDTKLHIEFANGEAGQDVQSLTLDLGQGVLGSVAVSGNTLRIDDVDLDPRFDSSVDRTTGFVTKSLLAVPIQWQGKLLGVLEVVNKRGGSRFSENDERLLELVANQAAIAMENSRLVDQMVISEQLSAIGKMAASIVHDFKGPLAIIRGFVEILADSNISAEKRTRFSNMVLDNVDRFLEMSQELLDYSRGSLNLNRKPVRLGVWLGKVTDFVEESVGAANIRLHTEFNFIGLIEMDEARVRRVVQNLIGNAMDAMSDGGDLTIATDLKDGTCRLSVTDTGIGIPHSLRPKVFEPFVTEGKEHGNGLGLAIAKEIVEGHGGNLSFETRTADETEGLKPGTTFIIELPVKAALV